MRTVVLLAVWMSVLSCGDGKVRKQESPRDAAERDVQASQRPSTVDPFVEGNSYRFVMTTASTPRLGEVERGGRSLHPRVCQPRS